MHRPLFGGQVLVGVAFALVVLLSNSAEAALTYYWNFEETNNTPSPQVRDLTGTRHGTFIGTLGDGNRTNDVPLGIGSTKSLNFNSAPTYTNNASNYVDVHGPSGSYLVMSNTADWTVSLWYKGTDAGSTPTLHVLLGGSPSNAGLELRTGGYVVYTHYNGVAYQDNVISDNPINNNEWHNITLVHYANQTADLYVDAKAQALPLGNSTTTPIGNPWQIGSFMTSGFGFISGKLDDIRIYNNTLTAAEVFALVPKHANASE